MVKKSIRKDKFLRKQYKNLETLDLINKSFKKSLKIYNISGFLLKKQKKIHSKVRIRNYCFKTGRSRGVVPFFRISRMLVREKAGIGLLPGVFKD